MTTFSADTPTSPSTDAPPPPGTWPHIDWAVRGVMGALADPATALLALAAFMVPVFRWRSLEDSFHSPKVLLVWGTVLLVSLVLVLRRPRPGVRVHDAAVVWAFRSFIAWQLVSSLWAGSGALATFGIVHLAGAWALYECARRSLVGRWAAAAVLAAGIGAGVVNCAWAVMEDTMRAFGVATIDARLPDWRGYLAAGLGNSGHIAGLAGLYLLPLLAVFGCLQRSSWPLRGALVLAFAGFTITWSVGSTGASLLALSIWAVVAWRCGLARYIFGRRVAEAAVIAGLVAAFYLLPHRANPHPMGLWREAFSSQRWKDGAPTRVAIWKTTEAMIAERPWLGAGVGNFTRAYVMQVAPAVAADPELAVYAGGYTNDAHNDTLQIWAESGVVGLALWAGLIVCWYASLWRRFRRGGTPGDQLIWCAAGCGITVFLLDGLMSFPMRLVGHWASLALLMAIPVATDPTTNPDDVPRRLPAGQRALATALSLLAIWAMVFQTRRAIAEWNLKAARVITASSGIVVRGVAMPLWPALEQQVGAALVAVAQGDDRTVSSSLQLAAQVAADPGMRKAVAHLETALRADERYSNAGSRMGTYLLAAGKLPEAERVLRRTLMDLESSEIQERLGLIEWLTGRRKEARERWAMLAQRRPAMAEYFRALAARP